MELTGTVLNVVDFGCFVDIGMHDSGLVHVSHLADRYIRDPHEVVTVGDVVKVWVLSVDKQRRRVSLTMVQPGTERPRPPRHGRKPQHGEKAEGASAEAPPADGTRSGEARPQAPADQKEHYRDKFSRRDREQQNRPPRGGRPPRSEGQPSATNRSEQRRSQPSRTRQHSQHPPRSKPKPFIPITDAMKEGKEPMRTFGDLMQFYEQKSKPPQQPQKPAQQPPDAKEINLPPAAEITQAGDQAIQVDDQVPMTKDEGQTEMHNAESQTQDTEQMPQSVEAESGDKGA